MTYDFLMLVSILEFVIIAYLVFIAFRLKRTCNIFANLICEISDTLSSVIKKDNTCKK